MVVLAVCLLGLFLAAASADANVVWTCTNFVYADGFIYQRKDSSGAALPDLGDFPAKQVFPMNLAITNHGTSSPFDPVLAAVRTDTHAYTALPEQLYLDKSPGAFAPVGFVTGADNSTLKGGQTTWGFYGTYGFLLFSPTGAAADVAGPGSEEGGRGSRHVVAQQGYTWVETELPGVSQLYWNQTQFEEVTARGSPSGVEGATTFGMCLGDYEAVVTPAAAGTSGVTL